MLLMAIRTKLVSVAVRLATPNVPTSALDAQNPSDRVEDQAMTSWQRRDPEHRHAALEQLGGRDVARERRSCGVARCHSHIPGEVAQEANT